MLTYKIDEEITLRSFKETDAIEFYELTMVSKTYLKGWLGWLDYTKTVEDSLQHIKSQLDEVEKNGGYPQTFAIIYREKIVGTIGYNEIKRPNRIGRIGYWIGEDYQGKGIMSKTFEWIINYGFKKLQLNRIEVAAAVENYRSRALPERFGFIQEGIIRQAEWLYDHYVDHALYGLLAVEWESNELE